MEQNNSQNVISLAKQGDHAAIHQLYLQTRNFAYFIAKRYIKNDKDVARIMKNSYVEALKVANIPNDYEFKKVLYGIISAKSLSLMKKRGGKLDSGHEMTNFAEDEEMFGRMGPEAAAMPVDMAKDVYADFVLKFAGRKPLGGIIALIAAIVILLAVIAASIYFFGMPAYKNFILTGQWS